jgi:hypothetical protein
MKIDPIERPYAYRAIKIAQQIIRVLFVTSMVFCFWNSTVPHVFGLPHLGFFESMGMLMLCRVLFTDPSLGK